MRLHSRRVAGLGDPPAFYRCRWTIPTDEQGKTFTFTPRAETDDGKTVDSPHLIVTDVFPYGGNMCINEYVVGWSPLRYDWKEFTLPSRGECNGSVGTAEPDELDVFAITIDVIKVKNGAVQLAYWQ